MIWTHGESLTLNFFISNGTEVLETEVWDFETGNNWTTEPSLPGYADGIALYFVDGNFCYSSDYDDDSFDIWDLYG